MAGPGADARCTLSKLTLLVYHTAPFLQEPAPSVRIGIIAHYKEAAMPRGTYFLGATVVTHQACERVKKYREKVLGPEEVRQEELHLTVLPPFETRFHEASELNVGTALLTLLPRHPVNTTIFEMRAMDVMEYGGEHFLHFPIAAYGSGPETWQEYVLRVRQQFIDRGFCFKQPIPPGYRSHITVCGSKDLSSDRSIQRLIQESRREPPLFFRVAFLTLYAKYRHGWDMLSHDPSQD